MVARQERLHRFPNPYRRVALGRVSNDAKGGFVDSHSQATQVLPNPGALQVGALNGERQEAVNGTRALLLIEAKLGEDRRQSADDASVW